MNGGGDIILALSNNMTLFFQKDIWETAKKAFKNISIGTYLLICYIATSTKFSLSSNFVQISIEVLGLLLIGLIEHKETFLFPVRAVSFHDQL